MKKYANNHLYSDVRPCEVVEVKSEKKVIVREMKAERDPDWKPDFVAGGFTAHCTNNNRQNWICSSDPDGHLMAISKRKDGRWYEVGGNYNSFVFSDKPLKHHDYNF